MYKKILKKMSEALGYKLVNKDLIRKLKMLNTVKKKLELNGLKMEL